MLSTCPNCLSQVLHPDQLENVKCECGENFSPFLRVEVPEMNPSPLQGSPLMMVNEKNGLPDFSLFSESPPDSQEVSAKRELEPLAEFNAGPIVSQDSGSQPDYSESESVFADIRSFGESLDKTHPDTKINTEAGSPVIGPGNQPALITGNSEMLMTAGDSLPGFQILNLLSPISTWCLVDLNIEDPLKLGFEQLWVKAKNLQADGIIALRWSFTPDSSKILLSGTCVKCQKS